MSGGESSVRRILIVDDNAAIHEDFRKILCGGGGGGSGDDLAALERSLFGDGADPDAPAPAASFELHSALQGAQAVAMVRAAKASGAGYEMAFVDIRMPPGIDGIEAIEQIWAECPDVQVVICSAFSDYEFDDIVRKFGPRDNLVILKKPFEAIEVRQLAHAMTEKWRMGRKAELRMSELEAAVRERTSELEDHRGRLEAAVDRLESTQAQLVQAQKLEAIGQLAAGIAHEINTPIQYVTDNLLFLRQSFESVARRAAEGGAAPAPAPDGAAGDDDLAFILEEVPQAFEQALDGLRRVADIVRSMKQFAHPGGGELVPSDLNEAIQTTITICRNEWKYVAEMETKLDPDVPPVPCLPGELKQVFLNLIVNAAQALGEAKEKGGGGVIRVTSARDGDHVEIRVADNGPGMNEEVRRRVFDPFFTTKPVGKGTGQGLAIARTVVVEKHRGTIAVESAPGRGATFIVRLPLAAQPSAAAA